MAFLQDPKSLEAPIEKIAFLDCICSASHEGKPLLEQVTPALMPSLRELLSVWGTSEQDERVRAMAARAMAALSSTDDGLAALEKLNALRDPAIHTGIAEGLSLLSRRASLELADSLRDGIRRVVADGYALASTEGEQKALINTIANLRDRVGGLDQYLHSSIGSTMPVSVRTTAIRALDLTKEEAYHAVTTLAQDTNEIVRAAALQRLVERLDDPGAQSLALQRIQVGSTTDRAALLNEAERLVYLSDKNDGERTRARWVLELLAKSSETQIKEGAERALARLQEKR